MSSKYKVFTVYCDSVTLDHDHDELIEATKEYAHTVAEAIEPTPTGNPDQRHVRRVEFMAFDEEGNRTQYTSAGPFSCADTKPEVTV